MSTSPERAHLRRQVLRDPVHFVAFGFGTGLAPFAPGTVGTLVGVAFYTQMADLPLWHYLGVTLVLFLVGVALCRCSARRLGVHDHPGIVWDEVVGYLVAMTAAPSGWVWMAVGFLCFRFFDILKPWPIRWVDRHVTGGFGIMLDDVLAGGYSLIVIHLLDFALSSNGIPWN